MLSTTMIEELFIEGRRSLSIGVVNQEPVRKIQVDVQNFSSAGDSRRLPLNDRQPGVAPDQHHDPFDSRARADRVEEGLSHLRRIHGSETGMDEQANSWFAVRAFFVEELIVGGTAPELGR
jgi:hypothetical protein